MGVLAVALVGHVQGVSAQGLPPRQDAATLDSLRRAEADSLTERIARLERALALLREQVAVEAASTVKTKSRLQVELTARVLVNGFLNRGSLNSVDVPTYALEPAIGAPRSKSVGSSLRQSRAGMTLSVDSVLGALFIADAEVDFFAGGTEATGEPYAFPEPRLRTASVIMRWRHTELMAGAESPLVSDLNPITLASIGEPEFANAGNLWNWLPQVRLSRDIASATIGDASVSWAVQGALLQPASELPSQTGEPGVNAAASTGRPFVQGRLRMRWQPANLPAGDEPAQHAGGEIGIGVHRGWVALAGDTLSVAHAATLDARVGLSHGLELRGEAYRGRGLSGLGGGAIEQELGAPAPGAISGVLLRDTGAWAQLNWQATTTLMAGVGCGVDDVNPDDRPMRQRNQTCAAHTAWRPMQPLLVGLEFRRLDTRYADRTAHGNHLNFSIGFEL